MTKNKKKRKQVSVPADWYVPPGICMEVLARLPAKSVLRFRSVCKTWKSLIDDAPGFKSKHLTHCINNRGQKQKLLLLQGEHIGGRRHWGLRCANTLTKTREFVDDTDNQFTTWMTKGYLDGLLLLYNIYSYSVILLNLSIGKYITLPSSHVFYDPGRPNVGMGYDSASDDYKVVAWSSASSSEAGEIYSLNSGTWKSKSKIHASEDAHHQHSLVQYPQVFFKGIIHWIEHHPGDKIITFDVHHEVIKYIMLPQCVVGRGSTIQLLLVDGSSSLAILHSSRKETCIWVMEGECHGMMMDSNWTKRYTINLQYPFTFICLKENGPELFFSETWGGVKTCNIMTGVVKQFEEMHGTHAYKMNHYVESLVLFDRVDAQSLKTFGGRRTKGRKRETRKLTYQN